MKTVTRDSGANVKLLRQLEIAGLIDLTDVNVENGAQNKKVQQKADTIGVIEHSTIGSCVIAADNSPYERIREVIGRQNVKDAMHLETHIRLGNDYFCTEDTDFLKHRDTLFNEFNCLIVTPAELESLLRR